MLPVAAPGHALGHDHCPRPHHPAPSLHPGEPWLPPFFGCHAHAHVNVFWIGFDYISSVWGLAQTHRLRNFMWHALIQYSCATEDMMDVRRIQSIWPSHPPLGLWTFLLTRHLLHVKRMGILPLMQQEDIRSP